MVSVELVYVPVGEPAIHQQLQLAIGATVAEVLNQSGIIERHPEIKDQAIGIFGTLVSLTTRVKTGDRIEIYRPLLIDPKEKRRQRAKWKRY